MATFTDSLGVVRAMGDHGFAAPAGRQFNVFGTTSSTPKVSKSDWVNRGFNNKPAMAPTEIKDQGQSNECNPFAICYAMEAIRRAEGAEDIELSPGYIYATIHQGFDNGSKLEDGLAFVQSTGTVPASVVAPLEFDRNRFHSGVEQAPKFRVLELWLCPTFELMASAVNTGFPVVFGIPWGLADDLDGQGWIEDDPVGGLAGGHAMCAFGTVKRGSRWGLLTVNSWTSGWGNSGWLVVPEGRFANEMFGGAAWACRVVTVDA
jgi:hypothetical protein